MCKKPPPPKPKPPVDEEKPPVHEEKPPVDEPGLDEPKPDNNKNGDEPKTEVSEPQLDGAVPPSENGPTLKGSKEASVRSGSVGDGVGSVTSLKDARSAAVIYTVPHTDVPCDSPLLSTTIVMFKSVDGTLFAANI